MNRFNNLDDLMNEVESRIQTSLHKDLPKVGKRALRKRAQSDVHRKSSYKVGSSTVPARPYAESIENEDTPFLSAQSHVQSLFGQAFSRISPLLTRMGQRLPK